jgi:transcriptional regulator with XRE-family HTH domain
MERAPFSVEFGRRIARRRRILGLKQWQIAEQLGATRALIAQLEGGRAQLMRLEQLARLADALQTSVDYLLQRTDVDPGPVPERASPGEALCLDGVTLPPATTIPERTVADGEYTNFP